MSMRTLIYFFIITVIFACSSNDHELIQDQKKDFCSSIHKSNLTTLGKELEPVKDSMLSKSGVYVLEDGDGSMVARAWLTEHAEKTIDIQYFIFSTDNVGLIACDYLVRAADRGVKVRILVDDIMVEAGPHEILTMDSHENIDIKIYNPGVNLGKNLFEKIHAFGKNFVGSNQRMHNKVFCVDDKLAITGGRNIADEYFDYDHEYNFRDRDVLLLGKVIGSIHSSFETFWNDSLSVPVADVVKEKENNFNDPKRFDRLHQYACNPENFWPQVREKIRSLPNAFKEIQKSGELVWLDSVSFISDEPGKSIRSNGLPGEGLTTMSLIHLIENAKTSIDIQSPYLITTEKGVKLFEDAVKRGVKIRILTNSLSSTDNLEAFAGYQKCRKSLLEAGVEIYEFKPYAAKRYKIMTGALQKKINYSPIFGLHAKSMVVDNHTTIIGTFNLDPRSAYLNTECLAIIKSTKVAKGVLKEMNEEFENENAWHVTLNYNPDNEAGNKKQLKALTKKFIPKEIL